MKDLKDLLRHEVLDLRSAEDQIIESMPAMIEKAANPQLKKALREHLRITEAQRKRIDEVINLLGEEGKSDGEGSKVGSFFTGLFGGSDPKCKAMEGILTEGNKIMGEDMNEEVMDAAIISAAPKVEHYEICGYGTAKAFARELQLKEVERLLNVTLNEEYEADNILTRMAVGGGINEQAEMAEANGTSGSGRGGSKSRNASSGKKSSGSSSQGGKKSSSNSSSSGKKSSGSSSSSGSKGGSKNSTGSSNSGRKSAASSSNSGKKSSSSNKGASGKKGTSGAGSSGRKGASGGSSTGKKSSSGSGNRGAAAKSGGKTSATSNRGGNSSAGGGKKGTTGGKKSSGAKGGNSRGGGRGR